MAENEWDAKPTLRPLYKDFGRSRTLEPNAIETGVHKFILAALQRKARASAVSLGSLAIGKEMEMAEKERDAKSILRPLYKEFERGRKSGPNGIETGVHKFFLGELQRKPKASSDSLGSLAMRNMLWVVENWTKMAENEWDAKPTVRPF